MIKRIQKKFVFTRTGAINLLKSCIFSSLEYLAVSISIVLLYYFTVHLLEMHLNHRGEEIKYITYIISFVAIFIIMYFASLFQYNYSILKTYEESAKMRISLAEHLRKLPLSFFGKRDISDLGSSILTDVSDLEKVYSHYVPVFVGSIISTTLISLSLFIINFKMALATVWCIPVSLLLMYISKNRLTKENRIEKEIQLKRASKIQEGLETVKELRSNNYVEKYMEEFEEIVRIAEKRQFRTEYMNGIFVTSSQLILKLGIVTVIITGINLLKNSNITLETLLLFLIIASRLYDPLYTTLTNIAAIIGSKPRVERLNQIYEYPIQKGENVFEPKDYNIEFRNVVFSYEKEKKVLHDISFIAKQGEVTALIGDSGGGKTTCTKLAARFWDIDSGEILIGGINIEDVDPEVLLSKFSIVFQDVLLFNDTIMENIRLGKKGATDDEIIRVAKLAKCHDFIMNMGKGYGTIIGENGAKLSGGERQRISIARALLKDAPIILLDEATASLDLESETYVQEALTELIRNKTVIIIAHRMRTIENADYIVVLRDGKVYEEGTVNELLSKNSYFKHMRKLQSYSKEWKIK